MKSTLRLALVLSSAATLLLALVCKQAPAGEAPVTPAAPTGISSGDTDVSYDFCAATTDPDNDSVCFRFRWADGDTSAWGDWVASGETATMSHAWAGAGTYQVQAQAKDRSDLTSDWSPAHDVVIRASSYEIVLGWEARPSDLDAHFWTPEIEGSRYHVYYLSKGTLDTVPYCALDTDNVTGDGAERITIDTAFSGDYIYAVHYYAGDSTITTSRAAVQLLAGGTPMRTFNAPGEPAQGRTWWHVFKLDGATGTVSELNVLSTGPPDVVSAPTPEQPTHSLSKAVP